MSNSHQPLESSNGSSIKDVSNHSVGLDLQGEGRKDASEGERAARGEGGLNKERERSN